MPRVSRALPPSPPPSPAHHVSGLTCPLLLSPTTTHKWSLGAADIFSIDFVGDGAQEHREIGVHLLPDAIKSESPHHTDETQARHKTDPGGIKHTSAYMHMCPTWMHLAATTDPSGLIPWVRELPRYPRVFVCGGGSITWCSAALGPRT